MPTIAKRVSSLEPGKKIPLKFDPAFKMMFGNPDHLELLTFFLSRLFRVDYEDLEGRIELVPLNMPNQTLTEKKCERDIVVKFKTDNEYRVEVEVNVQEEFHQQIMNRNLYYMNRVASSGVKESEDYEKIPLTYLINLNTYYVDPIHQKLIDVYTFKNDEGYEYSQILKIYNINIAECYDLWYHNRYQGKMDEAEEDLFLLCASFMMDDVETYNHCIDKLHTTHHIKNTMKEVSEKMNQDEDLYARYYSFEERQKLENQVVLNDAVKKATEEATKIATEKATKIATEKATEETKRTIAKNLLKNGATMEFVSKSVGLSVQELEELKDSTE